MISIDARRWVSAALFLAVLLGLTSFVVWPVSAVGPQSFLPVIEEPWSICVVQIGLVQEDGSTEWFGTEVTGTPISDCQNTTGVLGEDVLGETIMFHQFIMNGTSYKVVATILQITA